MIKPMTMLCAVATAVAFYTSAAGAAPLSTPLALKSAETQSTEAVRYQRRHHSRWGAPRAYFGSGYNSYAFTPGYVGPRYRSYRYGSPGCTGEESADSAFPSWMCSGRSR